MVISFNPQGILLVSYQGPIKVFRRIPHFFLHIFFLFPLPSSLLSQCAWLRLHFKGPAVHLSGGPMKGYSNSRRCEWESGNAEGWGVCQRKPDKGSAPLSVPGEQRIIIFAVEALQYQDLRSSLEHETHRPGQAGLLLAVCLFTGWKIVINLDLKTQISVLFLRKVMLLRVLSISLPWPQLHQNMPRGRLEWDRPVLCIFIWRRFMGSWTEYWHFLGAENHI